MHQNENFIVTEEWYLSHVTPLEHSCDFQAFCLLLKLGFQSIHTLSAVKHQDSAAVKVKKMTQKKVKALSSKYLPDGF